MERLICWIIGFIDNKTYDFAMLSIAILTLLAALYIPRKIRIDQEFSALAQQYRSPEMGFAILSIFDFYVHKCNSNPDKIKEEYKKIYEEEIGTPIRTKNIDPAKTLQFQRRLVAYFYWDMAKLYLDSRFPRLAKKQVKQFVETNERNLISLVLQMSEANAERFVKYDNVDTPPDDDVAMNQLIKRLYEKTEEWV